MPILSFKGGIHPHVDGKDLTKDKEIIKISPGAEVVIPLNMHIGAVSVPIVNIGDRVLANQLIAKAGSFVSANIHSSVSGVVKSIEKKSVLGNITTDCIIIENDNLYEEIKNEENNDYNELSRDEVIEKIEEAGITGMGGAGFPTHVKLSPKNPEDIEYIIVNGAECEPYLTSDYVRMMNYGNEIVEGLKIVLKLFKNAKGIIAIEDNKPDAYIVIKDLIKDIPEISVKKVYTKYPQGGERTLIYALTKRKVSSLMLPSDVNCIVHNVDTIYAIYNAVVKNIPLTKRIVTVTGTGIKNPANYEVSIGTKFSEIIEHAGGLKENTEKLISGGPMMGTAFYDLSIPVVKNTSSILCLTEDEVKKHEPTNCINCGRCADVCPGNIIPARLSEFATRGSEEEFLKFGGMECCECGCCSYICPAKRNLTHSIKTMRRDILSKRKK